MNTADFELLSGLIRERSGLVLTPDKLYLLESRLTPVARKHEIAGLNELVAALRTRTDDKVLNDVVEAMTTNESFFFRDSHMFDTFRDEVLPALIENRQSTKRLRIWCAAASSGQEPYSIAMILKEMSAKLADWNIEILGTDISLEILERAKSGVYTQFEVQRGVPTNFLLTYFERAGEQWKIIDPILSMVQYRPFNLLDNPSVLGKFDVVFCRNVLIYFDEPTKSRILGDISGCSRLTVPCCSAARNRFLVSARHSKPVSASAASTAYRTVRAPRRRPPRRRQRPATRLRRRRRHRPRRRPPHRRPHLRPRR